MTELPLKVAVVTEHSCVEVTPNDADISISADRSHERAQWTRNLQVGYIRDPVFTVEFEGLPLHKAVPWVEDPRVGVVIATEDFEETGIGRPVPRTIDHETGMVLVTISEVIDP